jgi:hypothetical protein
MCRPSSWRAQVRNLASLKPIFEANGATVIDLTKPGWMVSEKNVESLRSKIAAVVGMEDTAIIFDLFGNSTYKFKHVDGTLVLPIRVGGGGGHPPGHRQEKWRACSSLMDYSLYVVDQGRLYCVYRIPNHI